MSGEVVAWRCDWSDGWRQYHDDGDPLPETWGERPERMEALVLATDYAELSEKLADCEVELNGETAQREIYTAYTVTHDGVLLYCSSGMRDAYTALQAKLDAVTKDAEALRSDIREIYEQIPHLPITPETMDAATDVLTKFCIDFNSAITGADHE